MKNLMVLISISIIFCSKTSAQENENDSKLEISGSVDTYWKYDFQNKPNINTYFTEDHNSISLGMIDIAVKKKMDKVSFTGEVSFGPRGQYRSLLNGDGQEGNGDNSFHIQNLFIGYDITEKLNLTAGFMGTFVGFEVISPTANFHYSTSYLFGAGPFQNAGLKATYAFSEKVSLMAGVFNDWNEYQDLNGVSHFGSQLAVAPNEYTSFYLNFLTGTSVGNESNYSSGTLVDLVANYSITPSFYLGLNAAHYERKGEGGYTGAALYPRYKVSDNFALGLRGEYYMTHEEPDAGLDEVSIISGTLSGEYCYKGFKLIPEIRFDNSDAEQFVKNDLSPTKNAGQFSLACVYSF